jgi:hypothetical protein
MIPDRSGQSPTRDRTMKYINRNGVYQEAAGNVNPEMNATVQADDLGLGQSGAYEKANRKNFSSTVRTCNPMIRTHRVNPGVALCLILRIKKWLWGRVSHDKGQRRIVLNGETLHIIVRTPGVPVFSSHARQTRYSSPALPCGQRG